MKNLYFVFKNENSMFIDFQSWKILPYINIEKSCCTREYELRIGFLCINFRFALKQNPNNK